MDKRKIFIVFVVKHVTSTILRYKYDWQNVIGTIRFWDLIQLNFCQTFKFRFQ